METILDMTRDLVTAQIQQRSITPETLDHWLQTTHNTLLDLWQAERAPRAEPIEVAPRWRSSITNESIICLECGRELRQLTLMHLRLHGLDAASYRLRFGIPPHVPLAARRVTKRRRQIARDMQVWTKAPHWRGGK
jgi:predicted transcriptional regulator